MVGFISFSYTKPSSYLLSGLLTILLFSLSSISQASASLPTAEIAQLDYSVAYVRCPRGQYLSHLEYRGDSIAGNIEGANDIWFSASNNFYMVPGCDLVIKHPDGANSPNEEVLVNCDENNQEKAVCTVVDPNVSFDGRRIVYTKIMDTREFVTDKGFTGNSGITDKPYQTVMGIYPDGSGRWGAFAQSKGNGVAVYKSPGLIFEYDLVTKTERQISPSPQCSAGRAYHHRDINWCSNIPVMDTGPFYMPDGRIGFTSNRDNGFYRFEMHAIETDGTGLEKISHRAMGNQLHPITLTNGKILYTSKDTHHGRVDNNNYSLFTQDPNGAFPFIFAGKFDATRLSYHYATQLSDGGVVVTLYYNKNNTGLGTLEYLPLDPEGADFQHLELSSREPLTLNGWRSGTQMLPFGRKGQFDITPNSYSGDSQMSFYDEDSDNWIHPTKNQIVKVKGKYTHPSAAPNNGLLAVYNIGGSSSTVIGARSGPWENAKEIVRKDAGIWLLEIDTKNKKGITHVVNQDSNNNSSRMKLVVDHPEYHELMPRAVVAYKEIYGIEKPADLSKPDNFTTADPRLLPGSPFGLTGSASLIDRETKPLNGMPWNSSEGGGWHSGRKYQNLHSQGADLAIYDSSEIAGIRVSLAIPQIPNAAWGGIQKWATGQKHHIRILGEFPVDQFKQYIDSSGKPDTSFIAKVPADTPFFLQTLDKRGMALDIEIASRTLKAGEQQLCSGCHVHTREGDNPYKSRAYVDKSASYLDLSDISSAPLFSGLDSNGKVTVEPLSETYSDDEYEEITHRKSFGIDWNHIRNYDHNQPEQLNGISKIIENRCASCHGKGTKLQERTGLMLDGSRQTYDLLTTNQYKIDSYTKVSANDLPGDGFIDLEQPGTDLIVPRNGGCCTASRWLSFFSARSSMLAWALYGERLDGRDPTTGLRAINLNEQEEAMFSVQSRPDILMDYEGSDKPEIWPNVNEHGHYLIDMPEHEKRLITRWIEIGAPLINNQDDKTRPVVTITPEKSHNGVNRILIGLWDDSPIDFDKFTVKLNGIDITPEIIGTPEIISVPLPSTISLQNAQQYELQVTAWDKPNRNFSLFGIGEEAQNRQVITVSGNGLIRLLEL